MSERVLAVVPVKRLDRALMRLAGVADTTARRALQEAMLADVLGPQVSGIVATYPVVVTVVAAFTHSQAGPALLTALLRALMLSMISFTAFFIAVGAAIAATGPPLAFVLGTLASLAVSLFVLALRRLAADS